MGRRQFCFSKVGYAPARCRPFVIDSQQHRMADALKELLTQSVSKPLDVATAYFAMSGYRLVKARLHQVGAFRLLPGSKPGRRWGLAAGQHGG
jgi:hypothetical protein